jgi:hypothetical protein
LGLGVRAQDPCLEFTLRTALDVDVPPQLVQPCAQGAPLAPLCPLVALHSVDSKGSVSFVRAAWSGVMLLKPNCITKGRIYTVLLCHDVAVGWLVNTWKVYVIRCAKNYKPEARDQLGARG